MESAVILILLSLVGTSTFLRWVRGKLGTRSLPYPPGPKKHPLFGNLFDIPTKFEWETYAKWGDEFKSDILHLYAAGHHVIVLNSFEAAVDLLDKKSSIYSSRPRMTMVRELMGYAWFLAPMPYGKEWKERRRLFQTYFSNRNTQKYQATQKLFVHKMLLQFLHRPVDFLDITHHTVGGSTISLTYGLDIQETNDPFVDLSNRGIESVAEAGTPGAFLVDLIPWLKYIPEWFPGAGFQKKAREWRKLQEEVHGLPFTAAVANMKAGKATPSFVSECLNKHEDMDARGVSVVQDTAATVFAAGSDTTLSGIHSFFVAMLCFPEVQLKAQQELDAVLNGRLPDFQEEDHLPYVSALVKEVLRWKPIAPLGVPHLASENDMYREYFIPQGAIIINNVWGMLRDPEHYPNPDTFKPERFLTDDGKVNTAVLDPGSILFGFGRR